MWPSATGAVHIEALPCLVRLDKRILREIPGILPISHETVCDQVSVRHVVFHQHLVRVSTTVLPLVNDLSLVVQGHDPTPSHGVFYTGVRNIFDAFFR